MSRASTELVAQAKVAESRGDAEGAARLFLQAGAAEEAARVYMSAGQFAKAGRVLLRAVGLPLERMKEADAQQRKLVVRAGICLAKGGEAHNAAALFMAAGDPRRAVETLERAGDAVGAAKLRAQVEGGGSEQRAVPTAGQVAAAKFANGLQLEQQGNLAGALAAYIQSRAFSDAGRLARRLGKTREAAEFFEEGALYYEAAVCWHELEDPRRCLSNLVRVPRDHPRYRGSCLKAIELSGALGELGFEFDQLVSRFVASGPENPQEMDAFVFLGQQYERAGFGENARECYRKVVAVAPEHRAASLLSELEGDLRGSAMVFDKIVREDSAFRGDMPSTVGRATPVRQVNPAAGLSALPELPELPSLDELLSQSSHAQAARARTELGVPPNQASAGRASPAPARAAAPAPIAAPAPAPAEKTIAASGPAAPSAPQPAAPALQTEPIQLVPGAVIADRYRLEKQIGQGGTAVVFRATDLELEEEVAIKVFTVVVDDPDMIRRFKQELSVTRALSHPNIVRLHDIGAHRGFRFLTMEILQGTDLASRLAQGLLPLVEAIDLLMQAASGLSLAHERGIIHRDIKPENFFVTREGVLKVMDFGIAKKRESQKRTQAGFLAGTPPYMSPEQISGFADVTPLADMYSLGIVAYEMFTGSLPFMHDEMMPLLLMHLNQAPQPPVERQPSLPKRLNSLVLRLLEKDPTRRVPSMTALVEELGKIKVQVQPR